MWYSETESEKPINGKWKEFNKYAVLVAEGFYENHEKHGTWRYYYDTGELVIEENYDHGKLHGKYSSYHMNGNRMSEGQYENGSREGQFHVYEENGQLIKVMLFINNALISESQINNSFAQNIYDKKSAIDYGPKFIL